MFRHKLFGILNTRQPKVTLRVPWSINDPRLILSLTKADGVELVIAPGELTTIGTLKPFDQRLTIMIGKVTRWLPTNEKTMAPAKQVE